MKSAEQLEVCKDGDRWHLRNGLPDLRIRQSCTIVRDEFDDFMATYLTIQCDVFMPTLSLMHPPSMRTARSPPAVLGKYPRRIILVCKKGKHQQELARVSWQWLGDFTNLDYVLCSVAILRPFPSVKPNSTSYALRGLLADVYSYLPKSAFLDFFGEAGSKIWQNESEYWVDLWELRKIAVQVHLLQGSAIAKDAHPNVHYEATSKTW